MIVTREMLIKKLAEKSDFYQRDIRVLLHYLDEVVFETFDDVSDDEEVSIQLVQGIKVGCKVVPERYRKDPRNQQDIVCKPQTKPFVKFSENFREVIQNQYESKKGD